LVNIGSGEPVTNTTRTHNTCHATIADTVRFSVSCQEEMGKPIVVGMFTTN